MRYGFDEFQVKGLGFRVPRTIRVLQEDIWVCRDNVRGYPKAPRTI